MLRMTMIITIMQITADSPTRTRCNNERSDCDGLLVAMVVMELNVLGEDEGMAVDVAAGYVVAVDGNTDEVTFPAHLTTDCVNESGYKSHVLL